MTILSLETTAIKLLPQGDHPRVCSLDIEAGSEVIVPAAGVSTLANTQARVSNPMRGTIKAVLVDGADDHAQVLIELGGDAEQLKPGGVVELVPVDVAISPETVKATLRNPTEVDFLLEGALSVSGGRTAAGIA
jgi:hypothetical protein